MNQKSLLIFDWDGTLIDSGDRISTSICNAALDVNLPVPSIENARNIIGLNSNDAIFMLFGEISDQQLKHYVERYRYHFNHPDAGRISFYDGVIEALTALNQAGKLLAIATGKSRRGLDSLLKEHGLQHLLVMTRCADETFGKPNPQMLFDILDFTGKIPRDAVMIGDTTFDLQMATNAGMQSIGVDYGMHSINKLEIHDPQAIFSDFKTLAHSFLIAA